MCYRERGGEEKDGKWPLPKTGFKRMAEPLQEDGQGLLHLVPSIPKVSKHVSSGATAAEQGQRRSQKYSRGNASPFGGLLEVGEAEAEVELQVCRLMGSSRSTG